jgi:hypothetical protein
LNLNLKTSGFSSSIDCANGGGGSESGQSSGMIKIVPHSPIASH